MKKSELVAKLQAEIAAYGDGEVSEASLKLMAPPSDDAQAARGKLLAKVLKLRKDSEHKDRYTTTIGTKTAMGVYALARRIVEEGTEGF